MDYFLAENQKYAMHCQMTSHIIEKYENVKLLYFIKPGNQQLGKEIIIACSKCIKKHEEFCCNFYDVLIQLNDIFNENNYHQIFLNFRSNTMISQILNQFISQEQFLFDGQPISFLYDVNLQIPILNQMHMALNHGNKQKITELFQTTFNILKEKISHCYFDIFNEPQIKIKLEDSFYQLILIQEQNIIFGLDKISFIYNYKTHNKIKFSVKNSKFCYNNNYLVYLSENQEVFLKIIDFSNFSERILYKPELGISDIQIIKNQLWIHFNEDGQFLHIIELNLNQIDQKILQKVERKKIFPQYLKSIIENNFCFIPGYSMSQIIDLRTQKETKILKKLNIYLRTYIQSNKLGIFDYLGTSGVRVIVFNFDCKKILRIFLTKSYRNEIYNNQYLSYTKDKIIIFIDIFRGKQLLHLCKNKMHLDGNQLNNFYVTRDFSNTYSFWFKNINE